MRTLSSGSEACAAIGSPPASSSAFESSPTQYMPPPPTSAHASTTDPFGTLPRRRTISSASPIK
jgi:hypothetical protein